ncbi:hypothetical protein T4C_12261 [Trichinella pseudospiralis]|uniref:Uncharacterized protein n=1 Tax=Trichinella pseudospiralis TaxID=6337 RepID=A0A0V1KAD1_TRIPS|nr:hypothetical protein T4D_12713 [Trichinella pseudospiralis]KRZ44187.1 hypothetical protein T4C_12261 [Trichinella pseudospiralis]
MDIVLKYFTKGTLEIGASAQNDIRQYLSRPLAECFFRVGKTTISEQPITQKGWSGENGSGRDQNHKKVCPEEGNKPEIVLCYN